MAEEGAAAAAGPAAGEKVIHTYPLVRVSFLCISIVYFLTPNYINKLNRTNNIINLGCGGITCHHYLVPETSDYVLCIPTLYANMLSITICALLIPIPCFGIKSSVSNTTRCNSRVPSTYFVSSQSVL